MKFRIAATIAAVISILAGSTETEYSLASNDLFPGSYPLRQKPWRTGRSLPSTPDYAHWLLEPSRIATGLSQDFGGYGLPMAPMPLAPVITDNFVGLVDDLRFIPPDTMGAVSPSHLVVMLNTEVGYFTRNGTLLNPGFKLEDFWAPVAPDNTIGIPADVFDSRVLYDQNTGKFVAVTSDGFAPDKSWILLAQSKSSDPTGGWEHWALPADNNLWADFPGLGIDATNIYITTNLFDNNDNFHHIKVWVIPKTSLVPGQVLLNNPGLPNPFNYTGVLNGGPFSFQPTHVFGTPGNAYIAGENYPSGNSLRVGRIWPLPFADLGSIPVTPYPTPFPLPSGPFTQIYIPDSRIQNVVYRNGFLYTSHTIPDAGNARTQIRWYEIGPVSNNSLGIRRQEGTISDPNRFYYYPSIAVNGLGDIALGFSGSSANPPEYPGSYYTARRSGDPLNATQPVSLLKAGEAPYRKTGLTDSKVRWGDYSATVVDPTDDKTFWTLQEYAYLPHFGTDRWATWWGKFGLSNVDAPKGLTVSASAEPQAFLIWSDVAGNTGFKVERRLLPGGGPEGDYSVIATLGDNVTTFTDNASKGLRSGFTYAYRVQAYDATGGSYSSEAFASTVAQPPPASGGGGGGCLEMAPSSGSRADVSSILHVAILFLPAAVYGWRRQLRPGKR